MKFARPILTILVAFACVSAVLLLANYYVTTTSKPSSLVLASANPVHAAPPSTATAPSSRSETTPEPTATPPPTDTPAPTPTATEIPPIQPPPPPRISSTAFQQGMALRRDGDFAHAADAFRAVLSQKPDPVLAREAQFRLGESLWLAHDYKNAITALGAVIGANGNDNFAGRAHYFLAQILTDQQSYDQAIQHLRAYRAQTKMLGGEIDAEIGDVILASGDPAGAIAQYNTALKDTTLTAAQRAKFLESIAAAELKRNSPDAAVARLGEAMTIAPDGETAADVEYHLGLALEAANRHAEAVTHWRHALATYPDQDGGYFSLVKLLDANETVDDFLRGLADYNYQSYDAAVVAFNRYAQANPTHSASAYYYSGLSSKMNGDYALAAQSFDALLRLQPNDYRVPDALYNKADSQVKGGNVSDGVASYKQFVAAYPSSSRAPDALWNAAKALDAQGSSDDARTLYEQLAAKYPASSYASGALFNIGLDYYFAQDNANAVARWKTVAQNYPNTTDADHALFWLGKLAQSNGDAAGAQTFLKEAAKPPRSYYSWRALDLLQPNDAAVSYDVAAYAMNAEPNMIAEFERWLAGWTGGTPVSADPGTALLSDFHFRRGSELAQLDEAAQARLEFAKVSTRFKSDARILYQLARYYQDNNYFDLSIEAARQIQSLSPTSSDEQLPLYLRELIYPTYFADLVVPYAQKNGFDPALFFALIRQESTFNPLSKSWVGAAGLTQVMPQTGTGIARDLGVQGYKTSDLYKPYVSVRFGTFFFGQLVNYFKGNIFYSLAGYNGGPGNAKKWQRPDVDVAVEIIHLPESALYVRTIYSQYNQYLEVYRGR